jgi:hypothetical protein
MANVNQILEKLGRYSKPKKSSRKKAHYTPEQRAMFRSFIEGCTKPDPSLVTTAEEAKAYIDTISSRIDELKAMQTSSTKSAERRLYGWRKGWFDILRRLEMDFSKSSFRK